MGGAVRDLTYGQQVVRDLDFHRRGSAATDSARHTHRRCRQRPAAARASPWLSRPWRWNTRDLDEHFNSAELVFSSGVRAELAMCREEIYSRPGQRPEVRPAMVFEDLKRRDFAINAMAVSLHPNSRGLLLDPTNGAGDIERHEIRALQSRGFLDDPSRIYRLLRLGLRLDFKPDERTQRWLDAALEDGAWERLDADQQARELAAILHEDQPGRILKMLSDAKLLGGLDKKLASAHLALRSLCAHSQRAAKRSRCRSFPAEFPLPGGKAGRGPQSASGQEDHSATARPSSWRSASSTDAKKLERVLSSAKAELAQPGLCSAFAAASAAAASTCSPTPKAPRCKTALRVSFLSLHRLIPQLPRTELQSLGVKPGRNSTAFWADFRPPAGRKDQVASPAHERDARTGGHQGTSSGAASSPKEGKDAPPEQLPRVSPAKREQNRVGTASPQRKVKGAVRATGTWRHPAPVVAKFIPLPNPSPIKPRGRRGWSFNLSLL